MCAGCGTLVDEREQPWVILATGKIIHHGGALGDACYRKLNGFAS